MNFKLKNLVFLFLVIFSFESNANLKKINELCRITSDIDSNMAILNYEMNDESRLVEHFFQDSYEAGKLVSHEELDLNKLNNGGIIMLKRDKHVVVRIWSNNFDNDQGGILYLDTLYSGINGERRQYEINVVKIGDVLKMYQNNREITRMKFIAKRSKLFGIIGIERIEWGN